MAGKTDCFEIREIDLGQSPCSKYWRLKLNEVSSTTSLCWQKVRLESDQIKEENIFFPILGPCFNLNKWNVEVYSGLEL